MSHGQLPHGRRRSAALVGQLVVGSLLLVGFDFFLLRPSADAAQQTSFALPSGHESSAAVPRLGVGSLAASTLVAAAADTTETDRRARASALPMQGYIKKSVYNDGWYGGRNAWIEEGMGGNWMNISVLKTYTHPNGKLKPRVLTKLRMADHKRAMKYVKRMRVLGLMPFHRLQAKVKKMPEARRPAQRQGTGIFGRGVAASKQMAPDVKDSIDQS